MAFKKQIATTLTALAVGATLIGGGTFAYFNSTATSTGNTFATGSMYFGSTPTTDKTFTATTTGLNAPGTTQNYVFALNNNGTLDMNHITLTTQSVTTKNSNDGDSVANLEPELEVTALTFGDPTAAAVDKLATFKADNGIDSTTPVKLQDLVNHSFDIGSIAPGGAKTLTITLSFPNKATSQNQFQNETATIGFTLVATR